MSLSKEKLMRTLLRWLLYLVTVALILWGGWELGWRVLVPLIYGERYDAWASMTKST